MKEPPRDRASLQQMYEMLSQGFEFETNPELFITYFERRLEAGLPLVEKELKPREPGEEIDKVDLAVRWGRKRLVLAHYCEQAGCPDLALLLHQTNVRDSIPFEDSYDRYVELALALDVRDFAPQVVQMHMSALLEWMMFHERLKKSLGERHTSRQAPIPDNFRFFPELPPEYLREKREALRALWLG